jgi:hypothetical protein
MRLSVVSVREFFRRHWPMWLGISIQLPSLGKWLVAALDWRGRYDALGEYLEDAGGPRAVLATLINPPSWVYPVVFVVGWGLIAWDWHRTRHTERRLLSPSSMPVPVSPQSNPSPMRVVDRTRDDQIDPRLKGWDNLFEITRNGTAVSLRFFPDTGEDRQDDALLLIVYGHALLLQTDSVYQPAAHGVLFDLLKNAHGTPMELIDRLTTLFTPEVDYGSRYVSLGYLHRTGLAKGGAYSLTQLGRTKAKQLAIDAIARA